MELCAADADALGIGEGDLTEVVTPRGTVRAQAWITGIRPGVVFLPFHYGYWDTGGCYAPLDDGRAAAELTLADWDAVSKQPIFKTAAARIPRLADALGPAPSPTTTASAPVRDVGFRTAGDHTAQSEDQLAGADGPAGAEGRAS